MTKNLAAWIDHTLLRPEASQDEVRKLCLEAKNFGFFGVCVNSSHVKLAAAELSGSTPKLVSVIGFPLGVATSSSKAFEAAEALASGAHEIDMVIHIGALKEGRYDFVRKDIAEVVKACGGKTLKVILETGLLDNDEKKIGCQLSVEAGANFVKTCTGFSTGKAEIADIRLMRQIVGPNIGVKASGGIKTSEAAWALIDAGATRLGTSSGPALVATGSATSGGY